MADSPARDGRQGGDRILVDLPRELPYGNEGGPGEGAKIARGSCPWQAPCAPSTKHRTTSVGYGQRGIARSRHPSRER